MNVIQKSEAIKNGLRKGFQVGSSKVAKRRCYGYELGSDGELAVNPDEAKVVCWIFEQYLAGDSLGKIAAGLESAHAGPRGGGADQRRIMSTSAWGTGWHYPAAVSRRAVPILA